MQSTEFRIKTDVFEGPLDLLLILIEKRKLLINDISLSKVADDFIEHIKSRENFPVDVAAHFILIASTLLLIKSKSLLPTLTLTQEEAVSIENLELRLRLYKRFKELSKEIEKKFGKKIVFFKTVSKNVTVVFTPDENLKSADLLRLVKEIIQSFPKKELLPKAIVQSVISLEEMITRLTERIKTNLKINFGEFAKLHGRTEHKGSLHRANQQNKVQVIVGFLAMLELVRRGIIQVSQETFADDIEIETQTISTPSY